MVSRQSKGGDARAAALTKERRRQIAIEAAKARWEKIDGSTELPIVSHRGPLKIGEVAIDAYRLRDGRRVISKKGMAAALALKSSGGNAFLRSMTRPGLRSEIGEKLWNLIENPIFFRLIDPDLESGPGATGDGYEATTLIEVCNAVIAAQHSGKLHGSQRFLYVQSEIIIRAAAKLGITALVDDAVGYIADRKRGEYQQLFEKFILEECRDWEQEFPKQFFNMLYDIYGMRRLSPESIKMPRFFSKFIRKYIYFPLAHSKGALLHELDEKNPVVYQNGGRRFKFHQFLTKEIGLPALRQHMWQVIGIGRISGSKEQFRKNFFKAFPECAPIGHQWSLIEDDMEP